MAAGLALLASAAATRRGGDALRAAGAAFGIAAGFVAGLWALRVRPHLPLTTGEDAWEWVFWFAVFGACLGLLRAGAGVRLWLARFLAGGLAGWLVHAALAPHALSQGEVLLRAVVTGVVTLALWTFGGHAASRRAGTTFVPSLVLALVASALLLLWAGRSASMAMAAGILATAVVAVALAGLLRKAPVFPAAAVPAVVLPFVGLLAAAHGYLNHGTVVRFPLGTALALAAAPLAGALVPRRLRGIPAALWVLGIAAAFVGIAALFAPWEQPEPGPW